MPITPLHVYSAYSLLRGVIMPGTLVERAAAFGHARLALTDYNSLAGITLFHRAAVAAGLQPLIGAEVAEADARVLALVHTEAGYANLCQLLTRVLARQTAATSAVASFQQDLAELSAGLHLVLLATPSVAELVTGLLRTGVEPRGLWLELAPERQAPTGLERITTLARERSLHLLATAPALLPGPADRDVARLVAAIRTRCHFDTIPDTALAPPGATLRAPAELARGLAAYPAAIRANEQVAAECAAFHLLPRAPVFPAYPVPDDLTPGAYLRELCHDGLRTRYGPLPSELAESRLDRELRLIEKLGFVEYFLVVRDIVQYARSRETPVAGRGSGASSLVAYVLGITNVCPLRYNIPFERFLHEGREDFPDLDLDFCWRLRDDVIDYAFRRWGPEHVAMVSMHNCFQPRSALRTTLQAFGFSPEEVAELDETAVAASGRHEQLVALSRRLLGFPHLFSVHPGGIVIGRQPIANYVPVQRAAKGVMITQLDKDGVEDLRLVKLDLLGNRNLSTVRYTCRLIAERQGASPDLEAIPPHDPATAALLCRAHTIGCNQLESPAMRHLLAMLQPRDIGDVMKCLALIRPGAASIGMKETFVRRRRGLEPIPAGHPAVDAVLRETAGVMFYEDDVMLVAAALLGASLSEADRFRRAVQKCRDDDARLRLSTEFLQRCQARGVDPHYAADLWVQMAKFNAYSFCRAHAASYAQLAWAGAWLKVHYPAEFWTAALNNNQGMYHPRVYVDEARRDGVRFLLPDVNRSATEFSLDGDAIRLGFSLISGFGPRTAEQLLAARREGPFTGISDLVARTGLSREEVRALILCGAGDSFGFTRPTLLRELCAARGRAPAGANAPCLFALPAALPALATDFPAERKYQDERQILGLSVRAHPLARWRPRLARQVDGDSRALPARVGRRLRLAGMLEASRQTATRQDQPLLFLTFSDEYGVFEVTVREVQGADDTAAFRRYGPYLIGGRVEDQYGAFSIVAETVQLAVKS